jgi:peptidoglycan/LPS O-acetylase OafA/YrhL
MDQRRHAIDALRALGFALLILDHWGMLYVQDWDWHIKSHTLAEWLQWPMLFVNRWRMDLIFLISGVAAGFLLKPGQAWAFLRRRNQRLLIPLVFGCLVIVPVQPYVQGVVNGAVQPGFVSFLGDYFSGGPWPRDAFDGWEDSFTWNHLWYLAYLWVYTAVLALLAGPLESTPGRKLRARLTGLRGGALLVLPALPLLAYTLLLQARFPDSGDFVHDWYRNATYFTVFVYGYLIARDTGFWAEARRLRRLSLIGALAFAAAYLTLVATLPDDIPAWLQTTVWTLRNLYVWMMLLSILGWSSTLLDRPFAWLPWAKEAVYPWYLLHQSLIVLIAYWLVPLELAGPLEAILVLAGTILGCWTIFAGVRRVAWLRPLFGLKPLARELPAQHPPVAIRHDAVEGSRVTVEHQGQEMPVAFPERQPGH